MREGGDGLTSFTPHTTTLSNTDRRFYMLCVRAPTVVSQVQRPSLPPAMALTLLLLQRRPFRQSVQTFF